MRVWENNIPVSSGWFGFYKSFTTGAVSRAFFVGYLKWRVGGTDTSEAYSYYLDETEIQVAGATRYKISFPFIRAESNPSGGITVD